ncbi:MAG: hypothetical protein EAZ53_02795 [Bacteroidetes bacterium]|nr:MAG: hypothetical protein EAZ53_02795 [Bacteroidota bacterium]
MKWEAKFVEHKGENKIAIYFEKNSEAIPSSSEFIIPKPYHRFFEPFQPKVHKFNLLFLIP